VLVHTEPRSAQQNSRRPALSISSLPLRPALREGAPSLATRHSTLATIFCFQSLTSIKFCNSFVSIFFQHARGWVGASLLRSSRKTLSHLISDPMSSTLVPRIRVFQHPDLASARGRRVRGFFSSQFTFNFEPSTACPEGRRRVDLCANPFRINTYETSSQLFILKDLCKELNALDATLTQKPG
jgi:hypothetical protein